MTCKSLALLAALLVASSARPAELIVKLGNANDVTFVGAFRRWDNDGNHRKPVNPKAKIDAPEVTVQAKRGTDNSWVFANLPPGRYDLVLLKKGQLRIEGFHYPPVVEFDSFLPADAEKPDEKSSAKIVDHIAKTKRYENKVEPIFLAKGKNQVRVLVQLVRDKPTSFDAQAGFPVATVRHEVWQYTYRFGGWSKERSVKVLDRILLPKKELYRWTWVWEPRLGGIEIKSGTKTLQYRLPDRLTADNAKGWFVR